MNRDDMLYRSVVVEGRLSVTLDIFYVHVKSKHICPMHAIRATLKATIT